METWSVITLVLCAHMVAATNTSSLPLKKRALHEHPTLVRMVERNNELRQRSGLRPHQVSPHLTLLAQRHAEWMARNNSFVHNYNHGYPEIIYTGAQSINDAFSGWMNSGPHRGIIMSGNPKVGYGFAVSASGQTYWCGVFGNIREVTPVSDGT